MKPTQKDLPSQGKALVYATLIAIVFSIWFLRSYFSMFVVAVTMAYLFYPLHKRFLKKFSKSTAIILTMLSSFLIVLTPLVITLVVAGIQLKNVAHTIVPMIDSIETDSLIYDGTSAINKLTSSLPFSISAINADAVIAGLKNFVISMGNNMLNFLYGMLGSFISLFTRFIIFLFVFVSLLKNGELLLKVFKKINPLGKELSDLYVEKVGAMIKGTVQGQFAIAITQGLLGAIAFAIAGFGNFFFVIFALFTLMSVIPLGAGILAIPAGIVMLIFGNVFGGIVVIAEHLFINTNVDNVLRPIMVPKSAKLDPALMLVSVFAGIGIFGFLGIIIGPTLMILIVTTIKAYLEYITPQSVHKQPKALKKGVV